MEIWSYMVLLFFYTIISQPVKSLLNMVLQQFMRSIIINNGRRIAQSCKLGCLIKYNVGRESSNKWIYIYNETYIKSRRIREERSSLPKNDFIAYYLLLLHKYHKSPCLPYPSPVSIII